MNTIFNFVTSLTIIQAFIYAFIFILNKRRNISLILLGVYLIAIVGPGLHFLLDNFNIKAVFEFPFNFYFLSPPIFYLYTRSILGILKKNDFWHLVLGIIEFIFFSFLFFYPEELARPFYENILIPNKFLIFVVLIPIFSVTYLVASIVLVRKYKASVKNYYSSYEENRLNWIYITNFISIFLYILDTIGNLQIIRNGVNINNYVLFSIAIGFIVYWISIYGLNQKNLLLEIEEKKEPLISFDAPEKKEEIITEQKQLNKEYYEEKYYKIKTFMIETKIFKDKEINLFELANLLQMPYKEMSNVINKYAKKNFNQFVNEFRVKEAQELIKQDTFDKFNLSGIAEEVGFNSRSTFFAAFKSITGMTPIEYKKNQFNVVHND